MQRRLFLTSIATAITGAILDPDLLTWRPGQRTYFDIKRPLDFEEAILLHIFGNVKMSFDTETPYIVLSEGWAMFSSQMFDNGTRRFASKPRQIVPVGLDTPTTDQAPQPLTTPDSGIQRPVMVSADAYVRRNTPEGVPRTTEFPLRIGRTHYILK